MRKIRDTHTLGIVSGVLGGLALLFSDYLSFKLGYSKRSYSQAASGMWVSTKKQARSKQGNILGIGMTLGLSGLGGTIFTRLLAQKGKDHLVTKGAFYGITFGAIVTAIQSAFPDNKLKPKDASSNLSYVLTNMLYGIVTTQVISRLGHESIFRQDVSNKGNANMHDNQNYISGYQEQQDRDLNLGNNVIYFQ